MKEYISEAMKNGIKPPKDIKEMTAQEYEKWLETIDPDTMGFYGQEIPDESE